MPGRAALCSEDLVEGALRARDHDGAVAFSWVCDVDCPYPMAPHVFFGPGKDMSFGPMWDRPAGRILNEG